LATSFLSYKKHFVVAKWGFFSLSVIEVCLWHQFPLSKEDMPIDYPRPQLVQGREEKKTTTKQSIKPSPKVVTK
jgi:hypothetical protein